MKERIDVLATNQGLFETREQAKRGVMAGLVVDSKSGERYDKPGQKIDDGTELRLKGEKLRYVSRGGLKLEKALKEFHFEQGRPSFTSIDVSFISLDLILPPLYEILEENGEVAALIKPQFEAGREQVGKNGIIRDPKVHQMTIEKVLKTATQLGFSVKGLTFSPIKGGAGNVEFLVHLLKDGKAEIAQQVNIESVLQKESEEL